jgi:hypothetical protein
MGYEAEFGTVPTSFIGSRLEENDLLKDLNIWWKKQGGFVNKGITTRK